MLITENAIRKIIEEELEKLVQEWQVDEVSRKDLKQRAKMAGLGAAGMISALGIHSGDSRAPEQAYNQPTMSSAASSDKDKVTPLTHRPRPHVQNRPSGGSTRGSFKDAVKASKEAIFTQADTTINNSGLSSGFKTAARSIYEKIKYNVDKENKVLKAIEHANKKKYKTPQDKDIQFINAIGNEFTEDSKMYNFLKQRYKSVYGEDFDF